MICFVVSANVGKTRPLLDLPGAKKRLSIWKADLSEEGSFDDAIKGCTGVFHVATPMDFDSKDPEVNKCIQTVLDFGPGSATSPKTNA